MPAVDWIRYLDRLPVRRVLEPTSGYWTNAHEWGFLWSPPVAITNGIGGPGTVIGICNLDRSPGPPKVYTIMLWRLPLLSQAQGANLTFAFMRARITLGTGGQKQVFVCDWRYGTQICVVANTIQVHAEQVGNFDRPMPLAVAIAQGGTPGQGKASLTFPTSVPVAGGITQPINIPAYATSFLVTARTPAPNVFPERAANNYILQVASASVPNTIVTNTFADAEARTLPGIPIHPEADHIALYNQGGAGVLWGTAFVSFQLIA